MSRNDGSTNGRNDVPKRILSLLAFAIVLGSFLSIRVAAHWGAVSTIGPADTPFLSFNPPQTIPARFIGPRGVTQALLSGIAQPVSLAHADFNGDGVQDLVIGYATPGGGGIVALRQGNRDAFAPRSQTSWAVLAANEFISPFAETATVLRTPVTPNFMVTGQFLGPSDLVTAARGGNAFYVFAGNGRGSFASPQTITVPGPINAIGAGRFGNDIGSQSMVVSIGGANPAVMLYRGSGETVSVVGTYAMQDPPVSFDFDDLDGDGHPDVVMVSGGCVLILHARWTNRRPQMETLPLPVSAIAVTSGFFTHDRGWRRQMAVVDANGATHIVVHGDFDPRPWTRAEIKAMRDALFHYRPNPFGRRERGPVRDGWKILESFSGVAPPAGQVPLLVRGQFSSRGNDDILAIVADSRQAQVVSHPALPPDLFDFPSAQQSYVSLTSTPVAAVSMPVRPGQIGLVLLSQGSLDPQVQIPGNTIIYTVNTFNDTPLQPNSGVCDDGTGHCSLRAAVMLVDKLMKSFVVPPVAQTYQINLQAGNYQLTIPGKGTTDASTGHLDVNGPVTIVGQGSSSTTVTQTNPGNDNDMVFLIDAAEDSTPDYAVALQGMTITGGRADHHNLLWQGGGIHWEAGVNGTGSLALSDVNVTGNFATDPDPNYTGSDDGGGLALYNAAQVTTPAQVTISGGTVQNNAAYDVGGGIAVRGAVSMTMSNTQVLGNVAVDSLDTQGLQEGGGIYIFTSGNPTFGPSYIHASTISANTAGANGRGQGGGIYTDQPLTIDQGSAIQGNDGEGAGGGVFTALSSNTELVAITASTITGNQSPSGSGGGVEVHATSQANLTLRFNRIFGNTASGQPSGLANLGTGTVSATDNWWGCNSGPQQQQDGCDSASGAFNYNPLVTVTNSANPGTVLLGGSTTLTAAFSDPNFGNNLNAFIGVPVSFQNPSKGTISNAQTQTGTNAQATATFTVSGAPTASADVKVDNAIVTASIPVMDFSVSGSPSPQTVNIGTITSTFQISAPPINGFNYQVCFSTPNPPLPTSFANNNNCVTGSASATLNIDTHTASGGTYSFEVDGTCGSACGNILHKIYVSLTVADFSVSVSPTSQTVGVGQPAQFTVTVSSSTGFNGPITLSVPSGLPAGTYKFDVNPINLSPQTQRGQSALTVTESTAGTYNFTVQGKSQSGTNQNAVTRASSGLALQVGYRPTAYSGQYHGPQFAFDDNPNTAATFILSEIYPGKTGSEVWSGWPKKPNAAHVGVTWSALITGSGGFREACIYVPFSNRLCTQVSVNTHTDWFPLPPNFDLTTLQVTASMDADEQGIGWQVGQNVYDIIVTVQ